MKIIALRSEDKSYFNKLASEQGTIFNTNDWASTFSNHIDLYGIYNNVVYLAGGFILYRDSKFGLSIYKT